MAHGQQEWVRELEAPVWRVLPGPDCLAIGLGGTWRDPHAIGYGPRSRVTAAPSCDSGGLVLLDADGVETFGMGGAAPIEWQGEELIIAVGSSELAILSNGSIAKAVRVVQDAQQLEGIVLAGGNAITVSSPQPATMEGVETLAAAQREYAVFGSRLTPIHSFSAPAIEVRTASGDFLFGCRICEPLVHRLDFRGTLAEIADLSRPEIQNAAQEWAREHQVLYVDTGNWALSYDNVRDRLLASSMSPPHTIVCMRPDGEIEWHRCIHYGCCAGPVRRIGGELVVASGCGGVVTWLSEQGDALYQSKEKTRTALLDPMYPAEVEPGPEGCVFVGRIGRLVQLDKDGREEAVADVDQHLKGFAWWSEVARIIWWNATSVGCLRF